MAMLQFREQDFVPSDMESEDRKLIFDITRDEVDDFDFNDFNFDIFSTIGQTQIRYTDESGTNDKIIEYNKIINAPSSSNLYVFDDARVLSLIVIIVDHYELIKSKIIYGTKLHRLIKLMHRENEKHWDAAMNYIEHWYHLVPEIRYMHTFHLNVFITERYLLGQYFNIYVSIRTNLLFTGYSTSDDVLIYKSVNVYHISWKQARLLWIGFYKNNCNECPIALLPKDIIKTIIDCDYSYEIIDDDPICHPYIMNEEHMSSEPEKQEKYQATCSTRLCTLI